jgi:hypothetical protein
MCLPQTNRNTYCPPVGVLSSLLGGRGRRSLRQRSATRPPGMAARAIRAVQPRRSLVARACGTKFLRPRRPYGTMRPHLKADRTTSITVAPRRVRRSPARTRSRCQSRRWVEGSSGSPGPAGEHMDPDQTRSSWEDESCARRPKEAPTR